MKLRPVDTAPQPGGGGSSENTPHVLGERLRSLWHRNWQSRGGDDTEPSARARGGTRLNDWPHRRPDEPRENDPPAAAPRSDDAARHGLDTGGRTGPVAGEPVKRPDRPGVDKTALRPAQVDTETDGAREPRSKATPVPPAGAAQWPRQFDRLSRVMADLCGRRSKAPASWNLHVHMDPQLLPDTSLHLSASQHSIQFRFVCGAMRSQQLLWNNVDALRTRIASEIGESRPFEIHIE